MSEWLDCLEKLRVLALEWTEHYSNSVTRMNHVIYLLDTIARINGQPAEHSERLAYEHYVQIETQLRLVRATVVRLARATRGLETLAQATRADSSGVPRALQVTGITPEYVRCTIRDVFGRCASEYERVVALLNELVAGRGVRHIASEWTSNSVTLNVRDLSDRLRTCTQIIRFEQMSAEIKS
ncbi:hypothetical protein GGH96_000316 [Coemansia sp. RSA 1972]|nr:hypothetical protein GGH96_000316 [Coemansia sp. RSA 1972]